MRSKDKSEVFQAQVTQAWAQGTPIPVGFAAALAGVTKQRIWMLIEDGTLNHLTWRGWHFVTLESVGRWRTGTEQVRCLCCQCPQRRKSVCARKQSKDSSSGFCA